MKPRYPIYIISKGRADSRLTSKALEKMNVDYKIVIEPQEYEQYNKYIHANKILTLPFSNLGQGSIPARNWVWEHSISLGFERHWLMDDNISDFVRLNYNYENRLTSGVGFRCMEDFVDRYENVALAGPNYDFFVISKYLQPAFQLNTRIYSCTLIKNDLIYRWRGKYNEDTDLSIRVLKDGYCTILFNAFLQYKATTMTLKGGNTDNVYIDGDNRYKFVKSLKEQHPELVNITKKFGRWHHHVNYKPFATNKLIKKDMDIPYTTNEYGMKLIIKEI